MIGQTISHYKITAKLGAGGMGEVYLAEDLQLGRKVAVKFLSADKSSDEESRQRFIHEARAQAMLNHPNIATFYEVGEAGDRAFIVMEYIEGRPLPEIIRDESLSLTEVYDLTIQIAEGLQAAHEKGVIHRDIKPENIMITPKGHVKITDFGLARWKGATTLTKTGTRMGTAYYMSPEQAEGKKLDHRSDIFSLGIVFYELVTGQRPFEGEHEAAITYSIVNETPKPLARYETNVSDTIEKIVNKCLAKRRDERYQSCADLIADLRLERRVSEPGIVPTPHQTVNVRRRGLAISAALVAVLAILLLVLKPWKIMVQPMKEAMAGRKSIAVLPFDNLSTNPENEYFSDGITEDIITRLSRISDLSVRSRTSIMRYKGSQLSLRKIGEELGVATILEGSVRRAGNQVRIVSQLIDANTDEHLWAETYDRELEDIFKIQSDVAEKIATALEATLTSDEVERIRTEPTTSVAAYDDYLRGRESYHRYRKEDNELAIVFFKRALEHDSLYALAYAGLGDAYAQRAQRFRYHQSWLDSAIAVGKKAIALAPNLAEGYKAVALAYWNKGWYNEALALNLKADSLNPNFEDAVGNIAWSLIRLQRPHEALPWIEKGLDLVPNYLDNFALGVAYWHLDDTAEAYRQFRTVFEMRPDMAYAQASFVWSYLENGQIDAARAQAQEVIDLRPGLFSGYWLLGRTEVGAGNLREAKRLYQEALNLDPHEVHAMKSWIQAGLGCTLWMLGEKEEARRNFAEATRGLNNAIEHGDQSVEIRTALAQMAAVQGFTDEAFDWLERVVDAGYLRYKWIETDPFFDNLRNEKRYKALISRIRARLAELQRQAQEYDRPNHKPL